MKSVSIEETREEVSGTPQPLHCPLPIPADQNICGNSDTHSHSTTPKSTDLKPNGTQSNLDKEEDEAWGDEPEEEDDIMELSMSSIPLFMSC